MSHAQVRSLIILASLFVASLITANLLGSKLILIAGFTLSVGIFVLPFTFLVCDLISEIFGPKIARLVIWVGLFVQLYALVFVYVGGIFPASPRRDLTEAYKAMFSLTPRMVFASIIAYTVSQLVDVYLFHIIKKRTGEKYFWFRKNVSTFFGQAIDTLIFMTIFLAGVLPTPELFKAMIPPFILKISLAFLDTPFVYLGLKYLDPKRGK